MNDAATTADGSVSTVSHRRGVRARVRGRSLVAAQGRVHGDEHVVAVAAAVIVGDGERDGVDALGQRDDGSDTRGEL